MKRLLSLLLLIFLTACASQPESSTASPPWQHMGSTSYEAQHPGLGVTHRYASPYGWIDVYVYGLQRNDWKTGVTDSQFGVHFQSTIDDVKMFAQRGAYQDLKIGSTKDVVIADQVFRSVTFRYSREGKAMNSATYLTAREGQLLKYRISIYASTGLNIDTVARQFIEANLKAGLPQKGPGLST